MLDHPLYSPNLAPCDFILFCKIKNTLKGRRFQSMEDISKKNSTAAFKGIKTSSVHASGNGNIAWRSAFSPRVTILRVINFLTL